MKNKLTKRQLKIFSEKALKSLGTEDLLFVHDNNVMARPEAYDRLAELIAEYLGLENK